MKIRGDSSFFILALTSAVCVCSAIFFKRPDDEDKPSLLFKPIKIFSRPDPHADKNTSPGLIPHLGTVLHGGSIGIEINPFGFAHGIIGQAKKVIPKDVVGHPSYEEPPEKDHKQDWEFQKPNKEEHKMWEEPEEDEPKKHKPERPGRPSWEEPGEDEPKKHKPERPGRPSWEEPGEEEPKKHKPERPGRPSWDDIGENPDEDGTDVPIEDIIQPRLRPKRFVESKIYHVPLLFRSNGRPYQVRIKSRNILDESTAKGI